MHSPWLIPFAVALSVYVVTAAVAFTVGQRLLNDLRDRFPAQYRAQGEPSYLAFAAWGSGYWRPVSASNFFRLRRYLAVDEAAFKARAERVRNWLMLARFTSWILVALALCALFFNLQAPSTRSPGMVSITVKS